MKMNTRKFKTILLVKAQMEDILQKCCKTVSGHSWLLNRFPCSYPRIRQDTHLRGMVYG